MPNPFKTQFGELIDVLGNVVDSEGIRIVPGRVNLEGPMFCSEFPLAEHLTAFPPILRAPIANGYEAAWVRARVPRVFGYVPEPSETEKSLLDLGFVAVMSNWTLVFPFTCWDYYGKTSLSFSQTGPDPETRNLTASAFWNALLAAPDELEDFSTRVHHLGAPVVLEFGCNDGEPYLIEHPEEECDER